MTEMVEYLDPRILKPDPNQPRQPDWSSEEVREELKLLSETFEAQNVINPIEIDENNTIILGERRWRAALLKGLEKIPVRRRNGLTQSERFERQLIDDAQRKQLTSQEKVWAYATGVVNINTNEDYAVSDVKQIYDRSPKQLLGLIVARSERDERGRQKRMGQSLLARKIGISQASVSHFLSWFKVGFEMQEAFMAGKIPIEYVWRVASLFDNDKLERTEVQIKLEQKILSGEIETSDQLTIIIDETRREIEKRRVEAVRDIIPEIVPEAKKPETPEELEKAARALMKEAERRKPPEQIEEERRHKLITQARKSFSFLAEKVNLAEEIIDNTFFQKRLNELETSLDKNPAEVKIELVNLRKMLEKSIKQSEKEIVEEKQRIEEEERKRRIEEEIQRVRETERNRLREEAEREVRKGLLEERQRIEEKARKEAKEELMKDQEFLSQVVQTTLRPSSETPPRISLLDREIPVKLIDEIDVGEVECPKCGVTLRLIHCEPGRAHKIQRKA